MVDSADEARRVAAIAAAALRLVNEVAADSLVAAAERGETRARVEIEPVQLPNNGSEVGRLYDGKLIEALDGAGEGVLARACRIFAALGFDVATVPAGKRREAPGPGFEKVDGVVITWLELGFAAAERNGRAAAPSLLKAVALPGAHLWRTRAESARRIGALERKALGAVAEHAERGGRSCRLPWRVLASGQPDANLLKQLAELLRGRGFRVEEIEAPAALRVHW